MINWILIGTLLGSTVTSPHDTREACEGRAVVLREKGVTNIKCENMSGGTTGAVTTRLSPGSGIIQYNLN